MKRSTTVVCIFFALSLAGSARAGVGDPQIRTDHPWYPGELACSTFERLFATQAKLYEKVTGIKPATDHDKALASWLWRNTHYWHGIEGVEDWWGKGFKNGGDVRPREYWTGLFAHGFGLCGTTHSQWVAEMEALFGHGRGRGVGVSGHVAFEVFLKGGAYGKGRWALLDHDLSTVIYDKEEKRLLSLAEIHKNWRQHTKRGNAPNRKHGWLVCGLHPSDGASYKTYRVAEYLSGYSGPPPMVHLRRGETLRRYFQPGLDDGKTFVFWGQNYNTGTIPGPERSRTWVNQPDKMFRSETGTPHIAGQARYANAVYTYQPDFANDDYKEGDVREGADYVIIEFFTPYIIAATPPNNKPWGIYDKGCRDGLVVDGKSRCDISVSIDQGATWQSCGQLAGKLDLTDMVKGHRQYLLKLHAGATQLRGSGLTIRTVCQANSSVMPRLKDNGTSVTFQASGAAVISAGPNLKQAGAHVIDGKFGTPRVTMELAPPRGESVKAVYAAAHVLSGSPPNPNVKYQIELSFDDSKTWQPIVRDWTIPRRGNQPSDFWSQSFCWGQRELKAAKSTKVRVRFRNNGGKRYARCEVHLVYRTVRDDATKVTYSWTDDKGLHQSSQLFGRNDKRWAIPTGRNVQTRWVEFAAVKR